MNFHDRMVDLARRQDAAAFTIVDGTVYSIALVTATPTFTGVIGGYTTLTGDESSATESPSTATQEAPAGSTTSESTTAAGPATTPEPSSPVAFSTSAPTDSPSLIAPSTIAPTTSAGIIGTTNTGSVAAASATARSSSDTSSSSSSSSSGLSTGAKAGLAIGILAVIGLFTVFLLWFLGKRRRQLEAQNGTDDEKRDPAPGVNSTKMATRSPPVSANAPRISLRPVSRMLPEFMGPSTKSSVSAGNMLTTVGESGSAPTSKTPFPQPRGPSPAQPRGLGLASATQDSQDSNPNNPFADPRNPFADPEKLPIQAPAPLVIARSAARKAPIVPVSAATNGAAVASGALPHKSAAPAPVHAPVQAPTPPSAPPQALAPVLASKPVPAPVIASIPTPQPAAREAPSLASSAPLSPAFVAGVGGQEAPQGNVYRILMGFVPSMDDELELKAGQLVRLLHEYDDGWVSEAKPVLFANH